MKETLVSFSFSSFVFLQAHGMQRLLMNAGILDYELESRRLEPNSAVVRLYKLNPRI